MVQGQLGDIIIFWPLLKAETQEAPDCGHISWHMQLPNMFLVEVVLLQMKTTAGNPADVF